MNDPLLPDVDHETGTALWEFYKAIVNTFPDDDSFSGEEIVGRGTVWLVNLVTVMADRNDGPSNPF